MKDKLPLTLSLATPGVCMVECAVLSSGRVPAQEFLETELEACREGAKDKHGSTARARFMRLFQDMANYGRLQPKRFKSEMGIFWAFRHEVRKLQIRFPTFQDGEKWIVTHGFFKKSEKWPVGEIKRAEEIAAEYFARKKKLEDKAKEAEHGQEPR